MPTEHKKNQSKTAIKPSIKVEAPELHALGYYIDDRVELIRQIFMSLKSKTIKSIAPNFLQGQSLETIQEHCLDELLGISKKRLLSIINATQCPANTDSSDSDVENIEEHISLEEISSDSADDALRVKSKPKSKGKVNKNNGVSTAGTSAGGSGKKEISVLELLELQARARAIRSQLAFEPITKIELDSDNDSDDTSSSKVPQIPVTISHKNNEKTNETESLAKGSVQDNNGIKIIKPIVPIVRPVRLKRNFRQRQNDDYDPDNESEIPVDSTEQKEHENKSSDENVDKSPKIMKKDEKERSMSPDLIPIIEEPETYCISSDSDEGSSSVPKYITYPTVVKDKMPETEDEKFLKKIKEGSGVDLRDLIKVKRGGKGEEDTSLDKDRTIEAVSSNISIENTTETSWEKDEKKTENECSNGKSPTNDQPLKDIEPEEGELTDDDQENIEENEITILLSDDENEDKNKVDEKVDNSVMCQEDTANSLNKDKLENESDSQSSDSNDDSDDDTNTNSSDDSDANKEVDDDDDIIDLGKDEELDFEMREVEQIKSKKVKKVKTRKRGKTEYQVDERISVISSNVVSSFEGTDGVELNKEVDIDTKLSRDEIVVAESAVDRDPETDTWTTRWLRGKNVTKVMATSRLANKVRTKIKQKKSQSDETPIKAIESTSVAEVASPSSLAEEGSVQHYEELAVQETDVKPE